MTRVCCVADVASHSDATVRDRDRTQARDQAQALHRTHPPRRTPITAITTVTDVIAVVATAGLALAVVTTDAAITVVIIGPTQLAAQDRAVALTAVVTTVATTTKTRAGDTRY